MIIMLKIVYLIQNFGNWMQVCLALLGASFSFTGQFIGVAFMLVI